MADKVCDECLVSHFPIYKEGLCEGCYRDIFESGIIVGQPMVFPSGSVEVRRDFTYVVSAADILLYCRQQLANWENADLSATAGAINGVDMKTYTMGMKDCLRGLIAHYETRV